MYHMDAVAIVVMQHPASSFCCLVAAIESTKAFFCLLFFLLFAQDCDLCGTIIRTMRT